MIRTYLRVSRVHLCYASQVIKPGCTSRLTEDFRSDQKIIICQLLIAALIKATFLAASFVIPFEQKVILTETHDAISLASTISMDDPDEMKDINDAVNAIEDVNAIEAAPQDTIAAPAPAMAPAQVPAPAPQ